MGNIFDGLTASASFSLAKMTGTPTFPQVASTPGGENNVQPALNIKPVAQNHRGGHESAPSAAPATRYRAASSRARTVLVAAIAACTFSSAAWIFCCT